jgi:hypothetical protein
MGGSQLKAFQQCQLGGDAAIPVTEVSQETLRIQWNLPVAHIQCS